MSIIFRKVKQIALAFLVLSVVGCTSSPTPTSLALTQSATATESSLANTPFVTDTPVATLVPNGTEVVTSTPMIGTVAITANNGNLNIRRGPGISYNPIAVLKDGQTSTAQGRDFLGKWILIDIPSSPGKTGWVRTETTYSLITGDVESLPEVIVDFAIPAYVQNCTYHLMVLQPGDIQVSSVLGFPNNDARVYPGEYTVYDSDVPEAKEIMAISVKEGTFINIEVDGNSNHRKCP